MVDYEDARRGEAETRNARRGGGWSRVSCDVSGLTSGPLSWRRCVMQSMWPGLGAFEPCDTDDVVWHVHRTHVVTRVG